MMIRVTLSSIISKQLLQDLLTSDIHPRITTWIMRWIMRWGPSYV